MKGRRKRPPDAQPERQDDPSVSPLARFLGPDHPSVAEPSQLTDLAEPKVEPPRERPRRRAVDLKREAEQGAARAPRVKPTRQRAGPAEDRGRLARRRVLGFTLLVAATAFILLNTVGLAARWASPKLALGGGGVLGAVESLLTGNEVRILRPAFVRSLANRLAGPVRVGVQVGHLNAGDQPDELASLRYSTGAHAHGLDEVEVNLAVAEALAARLESRGFEVDLLPATVPPGYGADLLLSIHADSSPDPERSGYKSAHFLPARNPREAILKVAVDRAMFAATGLRDDDRNVSGNMLHYYAFNHRRYRHTVAARTPALLVELGYLSNRRDLQLLRNPDLLAQALEQGVLRYLSDIARL